MATEDYLFKLGVTPSTLADAPPEEVLLEAGRAVLENSDNWKQGKSFIKGTVRTYSRTKAPKDFAGWHCRVSEHTQEEATFDELWMQLSDIKMFLDCDGGRTRVILLNLKALSSTQSVSTMCFPLGPPLAPRVFTYLQTIHLDTNAPRTGLLVRVPIDLSAPGSEDLAKKEQKGVRGRYISVERVMELPNGKVEWRMATCGTPGGYIPQIITEKRMPGMISEDIPRVMHYVKSYRNLEQQPRRPLVEPVPQVTTSPKAAEPARAASPTSFKLEGRNPSAAKPQSAPAQARGAAAAHVLNDGQANAEAIDASKEIIAETYVTAIGYELESPPTTVAVVVE